MLPSKQCLRTDIGKPTDEIGVTSLVPQRLAMEKIYLPEIATNVSLQLDEMDIAPKAHYTKQFDRIVGVVKYGGIVKLFNKEINRLLAILIRGFNLSYKIPVAFFFVRMLTAGSLFKLTHHVITEV